MLLYLGFHHEVILLFIEINDTISILFDKAGTFSH